MKRSRRTLIRFLGLLVATVVLGASWARATIFNLNPTADTYVANKSPTTNFGTATTMVANNNNSIRVMLVRFDLSGVGGTIKRLKLNFTANGSSPANRPVKVYGLINGENWSETDVTWATAPGVVHSFTASPWAGTLSQYLNTSDLYGGGTVLSTFTPTGGAGVATAFDVTSGPVLNFVNADADKIVTFLIAVDDPPDGTVTSGQTFGTREGTTGLPVLTVTTPPPPVPPNPTVVSFPPIADTYVNNKSTGTNYGTATSVTINNNVNGYRVALMKFDLSSISGTISHLRLDLTGAGFYTGKTLKVYGVVNGEDWSETTVTWANAPGVNHAWTGQTGGLSDYIFPGDLYNSGAVLATFTPPLGSGTMALFDVSSGPVLDFINADDDRIVTFLIAEDDPSDDGGTVFSTREVPEQTPLLTVTCLPTTTAPSVVRVILLGGQSNAIGQAPAATLPAELLAPQTDIILYSYVYGQPANADGSLGQLQTLHPGAAAILGDFGPEVALGRYLSPMLTQVAGSKLAIIKFAKGGTSLNFDWRPDGTNSATNDGLMYQTFQQVVSAGLAKLAATYPTSTIRLDGMVWVQGEQDTNTPENGQAYGSLLTTFISDVRSTISPNLPFFFSRLSVQQTFYSSPTSDRYQGYLGVRQGQQTVAANVPGTYMLDIDSPSYTVGSDHVHFDANGQQVLGGSFASLIANTITVKPTGVTRGASGVTVTWNAIPGYSYRIQTSADLVNWGNPISVGVTGQWTDTSNPTGKRYYRILGN